MPTAYGDRMMEVFRNHPWCKVLAPTVQVRVLERLRTPTDWIFYLFAALCLYLGFIRIAFPKYLSDLFRVFFNTSLRGKQIREQLLMDRLPSLLLNIFFCISGGVFLYFLLRYFGRFDSQRHWTEMGSCVAGISLLYGGKYILTELAGLIFDRRQAAEIYSFVVFMVNKVVGLWLLPAGVMMAFASTATQHTVMVFALGGLMALLAYRLYRGWQALRNTLKINQLQYLVFVGAFEVVPVLLIYKVLVGFF
jgi:spore maturation protein SpmA